MMPPALASLTLYPTSVTGSAASTGTGTLSGPAPPGGLAVGLSGSNPAVATVQQTWVTVPAGATGTTFPVRTNLVGSSTSVTISASYGGVTKTAALGVLRPPPQAVQPRPFR